MDTFPRGAQSFLEMDGTYNWTKPSGQLFFLKRARELGVEKIVAFSNSPHRRQTKNGLARASKAGNSIGADGPFQLQFKSADANGGFLDGGNADGKVIEYELYHNNVKQTWYFYHVEGGGTASPTRTGKISASTPTGRRTPRCRCGRAATRRTRCGSCDRRMGFTSIGVLIMDGLCATTSNSMALTCS